MIVCEVELQNGKKIQLVNGDITQRPVEAIVNAANSHLQHGGGVAGAIIRKGGAIIQEESNKIGFVPVGSAVLTTAGRLSCKAIIHAVGPMMGEGNEDEKLRNALWNSLILASEKKFNSISIPAISSGIFGFPKDRCAMILIRESRRFFSENPQTTLKIIEFCIFDAETLPFFKREMES